MKYQNIQATIAEGGGVDFLPPLRKPLTCVLEEYHLGVYSVILDAGRTCFGVSQRPVQNMFDPSPPPLISPPSHMLSRYS
jgi:hypothetical protein